MLSVAAIPNIFCGILFIVISLPLLRGLIPMNRFYGFRISKAFTSNTNWYAINKYGAKALILWSMVMIAAGVLLLFVGLSSPLAGLIPPIICTAAAITQTVHFAWQLKNSNDENPCRTKASTCRGIAASGFGHADSPRRLSKSLSGQNEGRGGRQTT